MKIKIIGIILINLIMVQTAKARLLWSNAEPGLEYNDYRICTAGSNKTNVFGSIFDYLNSSDSTKQNTKGLELDRLVVYPNPSSDVVNFEMKNAKDANIQIEFYDLAGRKVKVVLAQGVNGKLAVNTNEFATGLYTFKYNLNGSLLENGKLNIIK